MSTAAGTGQPTGTRQPRAAPESPRAGGEKIGSGQGTSTGPPKPEWDASEAQAWGRTPARGNSTMTRQLLLHSQCFFSTSQALLFPQNAAQHAGAAESLLHPSLRHERTKLFCSVCSNTPNRTGQRVLMLNAASNSRTVTRF